MTAAATCAAHTAADNDVPAPVDSTMPAMVASRRTRNFVRAMLPDGRAYWVIPPDEAELLAAARNLASLAPPVG